MSRALAACVATAFLVQPGQATLTVTAAPDQCAKATAMELWRKSPGPIEHGSDQPSETFSTALPLLGRGSIATTFTRIVREPVGPECRWPLSDLPDGEYVALLVRPDG